MYLFIFTLCVIVTNLALRLQDVNKLTYLLMQIGSGFGFWANL